jgi:hypothetical protein
MRNIDYSASDARIVLTERHLSSVTKYDETEFLNAGVYDNIHESVYLLNKIYNAKTNNNKEYSDVLDNISEDIGDTLNILTDNVNIIDDTEVKSKFIDIFKKSEYSNNLATLGIKTAGDKLEYNEPLDSNDNYAFSADAFETLFNNNADSFYSEISKLSSEKFTRIIKPDDLGVKIDEYL